MIDFQFVFKGYIPSLEKGEVFFRFGFRGEKNIDFTEKISFSPVAGKIPQDLLKSLLDNLMLILGISYWKLYVPSQTVVENNFLTQKQAEFWNIVYTKGLGEFFYKNKIDFRGLVQFPYNEKIKASSTSFRRKNRALLGLGGGKDSIVAAEILRKQNKDFNLFTIGNSKIQKDVAFALGKKPIVIKRELDSKLFKLNKKEAYNGHIPISAIYAFLGLIASVFYDYSEIAVGNEKSADFGNVEYLGEIINHQWSKSEEFENLFSEYIKRFIISGITYSSPLRNMNELEIAKEFVKYPKYFKIFSSCNRNFKINSLHLGGVVKRHLRGDRMVSSEAWERWCGKCAKCLFVFISLAAFLPKKEVLDIFGKNLFEDASLLSLFEELIGVRNFKPFECVGTPKEVKEALGKIVAKREFNDAALIGYFKNL